MRQTIEYQNIQENRKYKDSLFCMVFRKKEDLLDLYNAINCTNYCNAEDLEINTLENVLYISMKNDLSFMVGCNMNLYEHQSTKNENMPLRGLEKGDYACNECIEEGVLVDILTKQRDEVFGAMLSTFNKELYEKNLKQNAYDDGVEVGMEAGMKAGMKVGYVTSVENVIKNLKVSVEEACRIIGISLEDYNEAMKTKQYLWKEAFWSQSFYVMTTGGASVETIRKYIKSQGEKK